MQVFPPASEPAAFGAGEGLLFWYGAEHVARAENSRRYRMDQRAELLPAARTHVGRRLPEAATHGVRLVLCVRPFVDRVLRAEVERMRQRGIAVWADYDDLLFAGEVDDFPNARKVWQRFKIGRRLPVYREGLVQFDGFTCSTQPIADALTRARPDVPVHVVPNVPAAAWIQRGWDRFGHLAWKPGMPRTLRYLPGSPSHDEDFAVIEDSLARLLHDTADLELEIVGYLNFNPRKFPRGRLRHLPKVPYDDLPRVILPTWLNLVPLAPTRYSQARSNIKELEAAAFDVPSAVGGAAELEATLRSALEKGRA